MPYTASGVFLLVTGQQDTELIEPTFLYRSRSTLSRRRFFSSPWALFPMNLIHCLNRCRSSNTTSAFYDIERVSGVIRDCQKLLARQYILLAHVEPPSRRFQSVSLGGGDLVACLPGTSSDWFSIA